MIFHAFVCMQVFNEINSRKLGEKEYNVFKGFFNNALFQIIIIVTIIVQVVLVEYGGKNIRTAPLTSYQHIICIVIGMYSLIHSVLVKAFLPVSWFTRLHMSEEPMTQEEASKALTTSLRKSFSASRSRSNLS